MTARYRWGGEEGGGLGKVRKTLKGGGIGKRWVRDRVLGERPEEWKGEKK